MAGLTVVPATRVNKPTFLEQRPIGNTLPIYGQYGIRPRLCYESSRGLTKCCNELIDDTTDVDETLLFVHDDIHLIDFYWIRRALPAS